MPAWPCGIGRRTGFGASCWRQGGFDRSLATCRNLPVYQSLKIRKRSGGLEGKQDGSISLSGRAAKGGEQEVEVVTRWGMNERG